MAKSPYLNPSRLEDLIVLIQYLGLGDNYSLTREKQPDEDIPAARSGNTWEHIASEHPEFFRVLRSSGAVTLRQRYYLGQGSGTREKLGIDLVQRLIENAIALQERQARQREVGIRWTTLIGAVVAAIASVVAAVRG